MVIDTLQHIRGKEYSKNVYEADVKFMEKLRDDQSFENNLRFNGETCYWEKSDPAEERKDDKGILVETLPQLFSADRNHWEGTATDLLNELGSLNPAMRTITTGSLGKLLTTTESTLYHNYGVHIRRCSHNKQRWIIMNYIEVK